MARRSRSPPSGTGSSGSRRASSRRGVEPDDRVAFALGNGPEFVVTYLAVLAAGAVAVPLNPGSPAPELDRELAAVTPKLRIGAVEVGRRSTRSRPSAPAGARRRSSATTTTSRCCCSPRGPRARPRRRCSRTATCARTSSRCRATRGCASVPTTSGSRVLPFFHVFGLNVVLGLALAGGASDRCSLDHFHAERDGRARAPHERSPSSPASRDVRGAGSTLPTPTPTADAFASVRLAVVGRGAAARRRRARRSASGSASRPRGLRPHRGVADRDDHRGRRRPRPGSIGPPLPGRRRAPGRRRRRRRARRRPGRDLGAGPERVRRLLGRPRGDRARARRTAGCAPATSGSPTTTAASRLVDRAKDLIIVSGFNVYPAEVEEVLARAPRRRRRRGRRRDDARTGEAVVAFVVAAPGRPITGRGGADDVVGAASRATSCRPRRARRRAAPQHPASSCAARSTPTPSRSLPTGR